MKNYISAQLEHVCWLLKSVRISFILDQSPSYPWFNMNLLDEFLFFHLCLFAESGVPLVASIHELLSRHRTSTQSQGQTIISESDRVDQVTLVDLKRVNTKWLADSQAFPSCIACTWPSSTYSVPITICLEGLQASDSFHSVHSPICRPVFSKCNLKIKYLRRIIFGYGHQFLSTCFFRPFESTVFSAIWQSLNWLWVYSFGSSRKFKKIKRRSHK